MSLGTTNQEGFAQIFVQNILDTIELVYFNNDNTKKGNNLKTKQQSHRA